MKRKFLSFIFALCLIVSCSFLLVACTDPPKSYDILINSSIENGVVTTNKQSATAGETITVTVTPNSGYRLVENSLKYNLNVISGDTFIMPEANVVINASFELIPITKYNVQTNYFVGRGTIETDKTSAASGETITVTVTPFDGYRLVAGSLKYNNNEIVGNSFIMPAEDVTITANFIKTVYQINYHTDANTTHQNQLIHYYSDYFVLSDAEKPGYLFKGWFTDSNFENKVTVIYNSDIVNLYPKYEQDSFTAGLEFKLIGNEQNPSYAVKLYNGTSENVVLSKTYLNKPVTAISDNAFENNNIIKQITFTPNIVSIGNSAFKSSTISNLFVTKNIVSIGSNAFENCEFLKTLTFENNSDLRAINDFAFKNCTQLKTFKLPVFVNDIGLNPFAGCIALENISVENGGLYESPENSNAIISKKSSPNTLIIGCKNTIIPILKYESVAGTSYTKLAIGKYAFAGCDISGLVIPGTTTEIYEYAFKDCSITKILIPSQITNIGKNAFENCSNLATIHYLGTEQNWNKIEKGENYLLNCPALVEHYNLEDYIISPSIKTIAKITNDVTCIEWNNLKPLYFIGETLNYTDAEINIFGNTYQITEDMIENFDSGTEYTGNSKYLKINLVDSTINLQISFEYNYKVYKEVNYINSIVSNNVNKLNYMHSVKTTSPPENENEEILSIYVKTADKYFTTTNLNYINNPTTTPLPRNTEWIITDNTSPTGYYGYIYRANASSSDSCYAIKTTPNNLTNLYSIPTNNVTIITKDYDNGNFIIENNSGKIEIENWLPTKYYEYMFIKNDVTGETTRTVSTITTFGYNNQYSIPSVAELDYREQVTVTVSGLKDVYQKDEEINIADIKIVYNNVEYSVSQLLCPLANTYALTGANNEYKVYSFVVSFNNDKLCTQISVKVPVE